MVESQKSVILSHHIQLKTPWSCHPSQTGRGNSKKKKLPTQSALAPQWQIFDYIDIDAIRDSILVRALHNQNQGDHPVTSSLC